ncbi:MAG: hypothetical protein Q9208_008674 [Pyrenodesmia sp. 3 TL-2023]
MSSRAHEALKACSHDIRAALQAKNWTYGGKELDIIETGNTTCKLKFGDKARKRARQLQPDGSILCFGSRLPFFVLEICVTQSKKSIKQKVHYWSEGSRFQVRFIMVLRLELGPLGYKVSADVYKREKESRPVLGDSLNYRIVPKHIIKEVEVYPAEPRESFTISLAEVLPQGSLQDPELTGQSVTISLDLLQKVIKSAVRLAEEDQDLRGTPPSDPHQESAPSPTSTVSSDQSYREESETEDSTDPDYLSESDSTDGDEPHVRKGSR